jgi:hypothetical protein
LNHIIKHSELPESDFIGVSIAYDVIDCADDLEVLVDDWGKTEPVPKDDLRWYFLSVADKLFVDCEARDTPDPKTLTGDLKGSGAAIVVMQSVEAAQKLIEKATLPPLKEDHDEHLTTDTVRDEPPAVIWTSFTKRNVILKSSRRSSYSSRSFSSGRCSTSRMLWTTSSTHPSRAKTPAIGRTSFWVS